MRAPSRLSVDSYPPSRRVPRTALTAAGDALRLRAASALAASP